MYQATPIDGRSIQRAHLNELKLHSASFRDRKCFIFVPPPHVASASEAFVSARQKQRAFAAIGMECVLVRVDEPGFAEAVSAVKRGDAVFVVQRPLTTAQLDLQGAADRDLDDVPAGATQTSALTETVMRIVRPAMAAELDRDGRCCIAVVGAMGHFGREIAAHLQHAGACVVPVDVGDATVSLEKACIVVSAVGRAGVVRKHRLGGDKRLLVDVGYSYDETSGQGHGDFDPACYACAEYFTPVPGGVGPLQVLTVIERAARAHGLAGYRTWSLDRLQYRN